METNKKAYAYCKYAPNCKTDGKNQIAEIISYANTMNISIVDWYCDFPKYCSDLDKSITSRENFNQLVEDLEKNPEVKYIIVSSINRIHRNCRSLLEIIGKLKAIGVEVITVDEFDFIKSYCEV